MSCKSSTSNDFLEFVSDRLTLLGHSVCMKPNIQGLLWDEFDGLGEDELNILFLLS